MTELNAELNKASAIAKRLNKALKRKGPRIEIDLKSEPCSTWGPPMTYLIKYWIDDVKIAHVLESHEQLMQLNPIATEYLPATVPGEWNRYKYVFDSFTVTLLLSQG